MAGDFFIELACVWRWLDLGPTWMNKRQWGLTGCWRNPLNVLLANNRVDGRDQFWILWNPKPIIKSLSFGCRQLIDFCSEAQKINPLSSDAVDGGGRLKNAPTAFLIPGWAVQSHSSSSAGGDSYHTMSYKLHQTWSDAFDLWTKLCCSPGNEKSKSDETNCSWRLTLYCR